MMAEFAAGLDDSWGLQSIVGGGVFSSSSSAVMDLPNKDDFLFSFPDMFFETRSPPLTMTDELNGVYNQSLMMFPALGNSPSNSSSSAEVLEEKSAEQKQTCTDIVQSGAVVTSYVPKYKLRRKNQQKRVVVQITAEDLSSDMWAWRKYGQKPIKGSPYPRSYYRCSSTKGCLARRQVEQSCMDASIYIVTYSGEHNHSQPTRKNALAGTIRHKFPNPKSPSAPPPPPPPSSAASSSPASSSITSPGEVDVQLSPAVPRNIKEEIMIMEEMMDNNNTDNNVIFSGINLDDDFFSGLEDIDDLISELSNGRHCLAIEQFPGNS